MRDQGRVLVLQAGDQAEVDAEPVGEVDEVHPDLPVRGGDRVDQAVGDPVVETADPGVDHDLLVGRDDVKADLKDDSGRTPLSWAVRNGHEAVVMLLLGRDDNIYDQMPLSWAVRCLFP